MKKHISMACAIICYAIGVVCSVYFGLWKMLLHPVLMIAGAFASGSLTLNLVIACAIKMLFSTTLTGLIWCVGYIGYNYFKGTEDPDWDTLNQLRDSNDYEEERRVS